MRIKSLPPTDLKNIFLHMKCAHLHLILWKAADQLGSPEVSISEYGWDLARKEYNCIYHRGKHTCTIYCLCTAGDVCRNSFTEKEDEMEDEERHNYDDGDDNDHDEHDQEEDDQLDDCYLMREPGCGLEISHS